MVAVCLFCGSSSGRSDIYHDEAARFGRWLGEHRTMLVYGGGSIGLMGVAADACLAAGGDVIGIIPEFLARKEVMHSGLTRLEVVPSMHVRKARMAELSDQFVALPGGLGTYEELFEALTWSQLALHVKPIGLLNIGGFFDPLIGMVDHTVRQQFCRPEHRQLFVVANTVENLFQELGRWSRPDLPKWAQTPIAP